MPDLTTRQNPRLIYQLTTAQRRLEGWIERETGGMSTARIGLLLALPPEGGIAMTSLARMLDLGAPALTGLVDRMSKAGLVRRIPDPEDGRSSLVELMDQGRTLRRQALERTKALNDQLCEEFSDAEIAVVARWLNSVRDRYGA